MNIEKALIVVKNNIHNNKDIETSMNTLATLAGLIFHGKEEKELMVNSVINTKNLLLAGGSKDLFDGIYLLIVNEFSKSSRI